MSAIEQYCKFCNRLLSNNNKTVKQKVFCSLGCQAKYKSQQIYDKIEETGKVENDKQARRYMIKLFGTTCAICGNSTWNNQPMPVVVDHIDGNSANSEVTNLRIICCNCDALLPTYKNRNIGNGRSLRRKRYKEGKSY